MKFRVLAIYILFLFLNINAQSSNKGQIVGTVFDGKNYSPLIGANVVLLGTSMGAATDVDGKYIIKNVPSGIFSVRALVIGYESVTMTDVVVNPIKPVKIDFSLSGAVIEFDELTVKPSYFNNYTEKPISTQMQTNEEIRRLPGGFEDVVRAISILPGVAQTQPGRNDLVVRGGAPSENLYVVDGLKIANINHFGTQGAGGGPLSFINLDFVKNTAFSSGGFGARYGDKLSSVLTINLREGRDDRLGGKATISASQFGMNLEGPIKDNGSFVFSARRSYLDFIFKASGFGFVPEYWDFLGKANYKLSPNDYISLLTIGALDQTKFFNDSRENILNNSQILGNSQNQGVGGFTWKHLFNNGFSTITFGHSFVDYNFVQKDTTMNPIFKNNSLEQESSLTAILTLFPAPQSELSVGMQGEFINYNTDLYLPPYTDSYGNTLSVNTILDTTAIKSSGWLSYSSSIYNLTVNAGVRFDYFNLIENNFVAAPRFSLLYSISPLTSISASVGKYYQAPSYVWMVANKRNQKLNYLNVDQFILGISQLVREDTKVSLEGYYKRYTDYPTSLTRTYLVLANTGVGFGGADEGFASFGLEPLVSNGTGWAKGIEIFMQKKLSTSPLYGTLSISYNQSEFKAFDGISRPSSYEQRWILNVGGGYVFNEKWEFSSRFRYATGRPYTPYNPDFSRSAELYNSYRTPENHFLDIRLDRRWYLSNFVLITFVDVQNIYNRAPKDVPRFSVYEGGLETGGSIGILPSIGISAEF